MEQNLEKIIAAFESETGYELEIRDGRPYYSGDLDLSETDLTSLPDGLTVGGSLDVSNTNLTSLPDDLVVEGHLDLRGTGITDTDLM